MLNPNIPGDMTPYDALRARIRGPVFPVPVPFTPDEDVDLPALHRYVDFLAEAGAPAIIGTVGTSRFNLLTRDEMMAVNATIAEAAAGRSLAIAAGPGPAAGSTRENIAFARHAAGAGCDGIMLLYPERWYSDDAVVGFFDEVAQSTEIGIMIHAVAMRDGFGGVNAVRYLDADLIERIAENDNVIGVKEENANRDVYEEMLRRLNVRLPIIGAGGAMRRFLKDVQLGAYTWLVGIGSFRPDLALSFYNALMQQDRATAEAITETYEDPYFPVAIRLGWHRALKATLEIMALMPEHERAPMTALDAEEMALLDACLTEIGFMTHAEESLSTS